MKTFLDKLTLGIYSKVIALNLHLIMTKPNIKCNQGYLITSAVVQSHFISIVPVFEHMHDTIKTVIHKTVTISLNKLLYKV